MSDDIQAPRGVTFTDQWEGNPLHRVILGELKADATTPSAFVTAVQWADGTIDTEGVVAPPQVSVGSSDGMTADQARGLALCILHAAFMLDGWAAR